MIVSNLFDALKEHDVDLWIEGDRLRFRAPKGALPPGLKASLAENKAQLVRYIRAQAERESSPHPLSYSQQAMWFLYQSAPDSAAYNIGFAARIRSAVDPDALRNALQALVDRHPALRTTYGMEESGAVQFVRGALPLTLHEVNAEGWDEQRLRVQVAAAQETPFDISAEVFRGHLFTRAADDHVLLLTVHHIAADGWSGWLLLEELRALYGAQVSGGAAGLPRSSVAYTDHVRWQRDMLDGPDGERLWEYWANQLRSLPPPLDLLGDRPRPAVVSYRGANVTFTIDQQTTDRLKSLSKQSGTTLFTTLLTAYNALLSRYTGQLDLLVGTPVFGRGRAEFQNVVGDFINTVVLRSDLSGNPRFTDVLARTRDTVLQALSHEDYPFPLLVQRLGVPRDPSRPPVFQTMFLLQKPQRASDVGRLFMPVDGAPPVDFAGLLLEPYDLAQQEGQVDLTLEMAEAGGCLAAKFKYSTDLFDRSTIERMQAHFQTLIAGVLDTPDARISDLPMLPDTERARLLLEWNATEAPYAAALGVDGMFEGQAARTPEAVALQQGGQIRTYRELNARANQIAHRLRAWGVGPGVLVAVGLPRTTDLVATLLAVAKAGGAYVPLDPAFPTQRLEWMLDDARPAVLVTERALVKTWPAQGARVLCVDDPAERLAEEGTANLGGRTDPEALAYVIFTSGSTGRPKGVQIPRRAVVNFLTSMQHEPGLSAGDRLLAVTTLSFDIAVLELFLPLVTGATVVLATRDEAVDGAQLMRLLAESGATVMQATPATWRMLVELGWRGDRGLRALCGGEPLPTDLAAALLERAGEVWNLYGPTETTVWSTLARVTRDAPITVGRPIANTQVYVLGPSMEPLPAGVAGELWIGGAGVARGYHGQPDLTSQRFVSSPFVPGARIYRTGDLARWTSGGHLEHLGRADDQVKIRGFRIELGEVEHALITHPSVRDAMAVTYGAASGDARLLVFVVPEGDGIDSVELRRHARERLPEYMVPAAVLPLDAFPLTANGKRDRKALLATAGAALQRLGHEKPRAATPRTPIEETLASIWADVLGVKHVDVHDDFFELGGHSLLAARMMLQLSDIFWIDLPLRVLFDAPTVARMAVEVQRGLDARHAAKPATAVIEINTAGSRPPFFFLHAALQGDGFYCFNLARHLGEEQPMFALAPLGLDGREAPATIEEIAAVQLQTIRRIQPHGPYYIGGFCASGPVAFEIGRMLKAARERVEVVVIVESYIHAPDRPTRLADRLAATVARVARLDPGQRLRAFRVLRPCVRRALLMSRSSLRQNATYLVRRLRTAASGVVAAGLPWRAQRSASSSNAGVDLTQVTNVPQAVLSRYLHAMDGFVPQPYDGRAVYLRAEESPFDATASWQMVASDLRVRQVRGDHNTCITTQVDSLASHLREVLRNAQDRASFGPAEAHENTVAPSAAAIEERENLQIAV